MNQGARLFWALVTAAALTWFTHWVSGAVGYPLGWGWSVLIGGVVAALIWYWEYAWGLIDFIGDVLADWGR